jgi:hypothetical protein
MVPDQICFIFHNIWDVILPIDELIYFSRWLEPPTMAGAIRFPYDGAITGYHRISASITNGDSNAGNVLHYVLMTPEVYLV